MLTMVSLSQIYLHLDVFTTLNFPDHRVKHNGLYIATCICTISIMKYQLKFYHLHKNQTAIIRTRLCMQYYTVFKFKVFYELKCPLCSKCFVTCMPCMPTFITTLAFCFATKSISLKDYCYGMNN